MKQHVALHHDCQVSLCIFSNRETNPCQCLREVYLDKSKIHQHCHKFDDSVWDPNDEQDVQVSKLKHKGNWCCFLCAIQEPDPREAKVTDKDKLEDAIPKDRGGIVPGTVWTFPLNRRPCTRETTTRCSIQMTFCNGGKISLCLIYTSLL